MDEKIRAEKYQAETDQLFESFLNRYFLDDFRKELPEPKGKMIELFIRGVCPSNCKYCYLIKHSKELYPRDCQDEKTILHNLEIFCKWYIKNRLRCHLVFFTGEIVKSGLIFKVLDVLYKYFSDSTNPYRPTDIIYPENGDFINDDALTEKMQSYIDKFKAVGIKFALSLSIDGKYMDENRDKEHSENFYKKIGDFADKNFFGFHPMVSAFNIDKWIDNYKWWTSGEDIPKQLGNYLMMLEVRDDNWTNEAIDKYLEFLNFVIDFEFEKCGQDKDSFARRVFKNENILSYYDNISIGCTYGSRKTFDPQGLSCSITNNLCLRLGDLAVVPCHRTSYDKFVTGYFKVDEETQEVIGYKGKNVEALMSIYSWNRDSVPFCCDCDTKYWCPGPCLGSNYECSTDLFKPPETVCRLFKARAVFLIMKYESMGLFKEAEKFLPPGQIDLYRTHMEKIRGGFDKYAGILRAAIDNEESRGGRASTVRV